MEQIFFEITGHNRRQEVSGDIGHALLKIKLEFFVRPRHKYCRMRPTRNFLRGPPIAEIIKRKRFARHIFGTLQWIRVAMKGEVRCPKNSKSIKYRQNPSFAPRNVAVPEFQMTAIFLAPVLIQVNQYIKTSIEIEARMFVEVSMDGELASAPDLMKAAPVKTRIGYKIGDSGYST